MGRLKTSTPGVRMRPITCSADRRDNHRPIHRPPGYTSFLLIENRSSSPIVTVGYMAKLALTKAKDCTCLGQSTGRTVPPFYRHMTVLLQCLFAIISSDWRNQTDRRN